MNRRYVSIGEHNCKISFGLNDPNDCWPFLTPRANILERTIRILRKYTLPSYLHPQTKYVYKSVSSFRAEKNRMIYHCNPFLLHPFSVLAMIRLISFFLFMLVYFIIHAYRLYFRLYDQQAVTLYVTKTIQVIYLLTQFMVGYVQLNKEQVTVEFSPKRIAIWNFKKYMCFDILETLRLSYFNVENTTALIWLHYIIFHVFVIALIHRFFISKHENVGALLHSLLGMNHMTLNFVSFLSLIAFCVHYITCFRYGMPKLIRMMGGDAKIPPSNTKLEDYLNYCHLVLIFLYKSTAPFQRDPDEYHEIVECLTKFWVSMLHIYVMVYVLVAARNTNKSKYKYNIMWNNVQNFLKNRRISGKLRYKILQHYQHKFQFKFFEEAFIIESLSKHLQYECQLQTCSHLIVNTSLLRGLPKVVVGKIVASFKPIVYLPNDVINTWQGVFDGIYFISYGTVAVYLDEGREIMHLEDGGVIGATGYYIGTNFFTTTSVTITEMYKLDLADLERVVMFCPDFSIRLKTIGKFRMEAATTKSATTNIVQLVRQLREDATYLMNEDMEEDNFVAKNI